MPKYILLLALLTLVLTTPHQASAEAPPSADVVVFIFGMSDSNRDGYVSWSEARAVDSSITKSQFDMMDPNKDGLISFQEYAAYTRTLK